MLDFFCSFDGCSMSMSYNDWPSTMATRSSSACVALISIRFIVAFLASGYRAERHGVSPLDTVRRPFAQARGGRLGFPALRHHGRPRERFTLMGFGVLQAAGSCQPGWSATRDMFSTVACQASGDGREGR